MEGLLDWYDAHKRDLPWRRDLDPYRVWVSEVMLQQTRVDTVLPHYKRWMARFPDVHALAQADEETVLAQWAGLGYYGRARRLHAASRIVAKQGFPTDAAGWRALPGVGPYMSAAIASITRGEVVAAIDGNLTRVLARYHGIRDNVDRAGKPQVQAAARPDADRPGDWNQALMDLGATVCTPSPDCAACPLQTGCDAYAVGDAADLPVKDPKRSAKREAMHFAVLRQGPKVLVVPRTEGLLQGTWLPPGGPADTPLEDHVRAQTGLAVRIDDAPRVTKHVFTHRIWDMHVHGAAVIEGEPTGARWVDPEAPDVALSTAARKALAQVE